MENDVERRSFPRGIAFDPTEETIQNRILRSVRFQELEATRCQSHLFPLSQILVLHLVCTRAE